MEKHIATNNYFSLIIVRISQSKLRELKIFSLKLQAIR